MRQRGCGIAGAATQAVAHARQDGCGRIRRDGRAGPSVTNPQDRRRRTSQSRAPKSDGEADRETPTRLQNQTRSEAEPARTDTRKPKKPTDDRAGGTRGHRRRNQQRACPATRREAGTMPKKRSTKKTDESKRAERKKLMDTDTYRQGDTPTQPESKISNRRGRPAPCRHAASQVPAVSTLS